MLSGRKSFISKRLVSVIIEIERDQIHKEARDGSGFAGKVDR